jgi:hypothetical protein
MIDKGGTFPLNLRAGSAFPLHSLFDGGKDLSVTGPAARCDGSATPKIQSMSEAEVSYGSWPCKNAQPTRLD